MHRSRSSCIFVFLFAASVLCAREDIPAAGRGGEGPNLVRSVIVLRDEKGESIGTGKLLFTGDPSGNLPAFDPASDRILWHFRTGTMGSNGPSTYMLNGSQYVLVGAGDTLFAFKLAGDRK